MTEHVTLAGTAWTLLPIVLTILTVFLTKKITLSIGVGIITSALFASNFHPFYAVQLIVDKAFDIIFESGGLLGFLNTWNFSIVIFLISLGVITAFVVLSGGALAFTQAIGKRVKSKVGAQFIIMLVGVLLMIDDYFNAMVTGNVSKNIAANYKLSRARCAYIVDSISAPICIIAPVSSWATAIMGNIAIVYVGLNLEGNVFMDFLRMIPYHFYVFSAIGLVALTAAFDFNIFTMKKYEDDTMNGTDTSIEEGGEQLLVNSDTNGTILDFILPIIILIGASVGTMIVSGYNASSAEDILQNGVVYATASNIDLSLSLIVGGLSGAATAMLLTTRHLGKTISTKEFMTTIKAGAKSMFAAIFILFLAWIISGLIGYLQVGNYVAGLIQSSNIYAGFIPFIMFIASAILAFSIGSSWGTFAIVLPIAGAVAYAVDIYLLLPAMSAVLSGAVFGDHASPISDTTVLSAAGSGCKVLSHFESQFPYAILAATLAAIGYLVLGLTENLAIAYLVFFGLFILLGLFIFQRKKKIQTT